MLAGLCALSFQLAIPAQAALRSRAGLGWGPGSGTPLPSQGSSGAALSSPNESEELGLAEASAWWHRASDLRVSGDFLGAAKAWMKSYVLHPDGATLVNAARAYQKADRPVEALMAFELYLDRYGLTAPQATKVEGAMETLQRKVGTLQPQRKNRGIDGLPARIIVGGKSHSLDDFPLHIEPGRVVIVLVDEGGARFPQDVQYIEEGQTLVLDFSLPDHDGARSQAGGGDFSGAGVVSPPVSIGVSAVPEVSGLRDEKVAREKKARARVLRISLLIGMGATALSGGSAGMLAIQTVRSKRSFEEPCTDCSDQKMRARRKFDQSRVATNFMLVTTGVVGLATVILGLVRHRDTKKKSRHRWSLVSDGSRGVRLAF